MTGSTPSGVLTAMLPCNDLDVSERFYRRLADTASPIGVGSRAGAEIHPRFRNPRRRAFARR